MIGDALFGTGRQAVLAALFGHPDRRFYQRQLIRTLGVGAGGVQRELARLARAGIIRRTVEGHQTYFQANLECPVSVELQGLVRKTFGVASVLRAALRSFNDSVRLAFVYGSVAAGREKAGSDVDVMLVGEGISLDRIVAALEDPQRSLGREINPSVYGLDDFRRKLLGGHHFVSSVVAGPKIFLKGDESELTRLAEVRMAPRTRPKPAGDRRALRHRRS